jgi:hypothetical protein
MKPFQGAVHNETIPHHLKGDAVMPRFLKIVIHVLIFAIGIPALGFSNFWDWELFRGMVLPAIATGFLAYLVLFILTGGYRVFKSSS